TSAAPGSLRPAVLIAKGTASTSPDLCRDRQPRQFRSTKSSVSPGWQRQDKSTTLILLAAKQQTSREMQMVDSNYSALAKMIDHSLLQPNLTDSDLEQGCQLAREYDVASVCIKPYAVPLAARLLAGSTVAVGTTVGFPHGGHASHVKVAE